MIGPGVLEVIWHRLIAVLEEASWTIVRTSLSHTVREAHDFGCLLYDVNGRLVVQNTTVAAKIGVYHTLLPNVLKYYRQAAMQPGDVFICNDPWLTEGHLYDISLLMPIFSGSRVLAFAECIAHVSDIGGSLSSTVSDLYGEGLQIPVCHFVRAGEESNEVVRFIENNVRVPELVIADLRSLVACLFVIEKKCLSILAENEETDLGEVFEQILSRSESAVRAGIKANLQPGSYAAEITADGGSNEGILLRLTATVDNDSVFLDFTGSSSQVPIGVNVCYNYAYAWAVFAVRTMSDFSVPNNAGCFAPISMVAPVATVINSVPPAPVRNRAAVAHFVPQVILAALSQASKTRAMAESGSPLWVHRITGHDALGRRLAGMMLYNGGMGARTGADGPNATSFPANARSVPIELAELYLPIRFEQKSLIHDSGGLGEWRGGCGQRVAFKVLSGAALRILYLHERTRHPARGVGGGGPGRCGHARVNGQLLPPHGEMFLRGGDTVELETPGGGGLGNPNARSPTALAADIRERLVTACGDTVREELPGGAGCPIPRVEV